MTDPANPTAATHPPPGRSARGGGDRVRDVGVFLPYLKPLSGVPALQVMSHRIVVLRRRCSAGWPRGTNCHGSGRGARRPIRRRFAASAVCISVNWLIYTWAVTNGHVVDASRLSSTRW